MQRIGKKQRIVAFLAIHAYSQMWLLPFGYKEEKSPHHDELMRVAKAGSTALKSVHKTHYKVGTSRKLVYPTHGSSTDWAHEVMGVKYSYALELRPAFDEVGGKFGLGFLLPLNKIKPTLEETWAGMIGMGTAIGSGANGSLHINVLMLVINIFVNIK